MLTITEEPGRATIDLASGKIGVAVASSACAGRALEIRTPNAVAAVRGTVVTAETAMVAGTQVTEYDVQSGTLDLLAPRPEVLAPGRGITVSGLTAGIPRAARPDAFTAGFERESGAGAASAVPPPRADHERHEPGRRPGTAISPPPPSELAGPISGDSTGPVLLPPVNGITRIPNAEIRGAAPGGGGEPRPTCSSIAASRRCSATQLTLNGGGGIVNEPRLHHGAEVRKGLIHTATGRVRPGEPYAFPSPHPEAPRAAASQSFSVAGAASTRPGQLHFITNEFRPQSVDDISEHSSPPSGATTHTRPGGPG